MTHRFGAYSFVDRITELDPGRGARGRFAVPADIAPFSSCLVAEAVGQLAAWVAMSHIAFRGRPVAALANETLLGSDVAPGSLIELAVEIEDCDDDAVAYKGWADVAGRRVITLNDCLGPMLPVEDFDSPEALLQRFELLCGEGAAPGTFRGVPSPRMDLGDVEPGKSIAATLHVPATAPFFADHFPRRAVFPATLLLDAEMRLAGKLAADAAATAQHSGMRLVPVRLTHVKMRAFIAPGDTLEIAAEMAPRANGMARILLSTTAGGKTVATARLELAAMEA
jgi:3-hydroxymyristoyl/3-hydroxydecanoyl-(acyl carrier protein) dehydratase